MRHSARPDQPVSVLGRICAILDAYGPDDTVLALPVLRARTGLPKATVHRLAHELASYRLLEATAHGFRLGGRLVELGARVHPRSHLRDVAVPHLEDLYDATRLTVQLGVLEGDAAVLVTRLTGRGPAAVACRVGDRLPLTTSALGAALAAYGPTGADGDGAAAAENGEAAHGTLDGLVASVADDGNGVAGVACPVLGADGFAVAAIAVVGPAATVDPSAVTAAVRAAALAISRELRQAPAKPAVAALRAAAAPVVAAMAPTAAPSPAAVAEAVAVGVA